MEAPNPITPYPPKEKRFPIIIGNDEYKLYIINSFEAIKFIVKKENVSSIKFEKSLSFEQLNNISKWFKIFDSLEEVFEDIVKLMEKKQINVNIEKDSVNLIFNINMEKIKEFKILLEPIKLSKDEIINNLIKENNKLNTKVGNLEKRLNLLEERFNSYEKNTQKELKKFEKTENTNILNLKNELMNTDIINEEDKIILNNWINFSNNKTIKLLYKASRDGDSFQDFYKLCENKGPTITVVLTTKGYKFGGYTKLSWKNPNNGANRNRYYEDETAFLFSLNKKKQYYTKKNKVKNAVCMWSDRGPSFGGGNDLTLHNNCLHNEKSYNDCPNTYETENHELNGGEEYFKVKDYEVYSVN